MVTTEHSRTEPKPIGRTAPPGTGRLTAAVVALLAFVVFVRTLAPGLYGRMDTPVFQFLGRVLGVAHNPGYPLYSLLTFPFSFLPFGTLAYRANLFSAVMGSVAVWMTFTLARRLGCSRVASAIAALGLAFGHTFW